MPDRLYLPKDPEHPSVKERAAAHICEVLLSLGSSIMGVLITMGSIFPDFDPSPSLAELNDVAVVFVGVSMTLGGILWLQAILSTYEYADQAWFRIRLGTAAFGASWLAYALTAISMRPHSIVPWFMGFVVSAIGFSHYFVSLTIQNRIVDVHNKRREGGDDVSE